MLNKDQKVLIIGQGLAGTILAFSFEKAGIPFEIYDDESISNSSRVAAGLWNPIIAGKYVLAWRSNEFIPFLNQFYPELERKLNASFFHPKPIYKIVMSEKERKYLNERKFIEPASGFFEEVEFDLNPNFFHNPNLGLVKINNSGWLDINNFLNQAKAYFIQKKFFIRASETEKNAPISEDDLKWVSETISFRSKEYSKVIFCRGYKDYLNTLIPELKFNLVKGETLIIETENLGDQKIINGGVFIIPLGNNLYKVGSNYAWNDLSELETEKAKAEITQKLEQFLKIPYKIIEHKAGIRPSTVGRKPFVGLHPKNKKIGVFGGLGTRGVMTAPLLAKQFCDFILGDKTAIFDDADLRRLF